MLWLRACLELQRYLSFGPLEGPRRYSGNVLRGIAAPSAKPKTHAAKIERIVAALESLHGLAEARHRFEPMDELVSCILSQHTSDTNSFPAFDRLKAEFPTWDEAIAAGPKRLAETVRSAGLANQKARGIIACLEEIKRRTGAYSLDALADMPSDEALAWLLSLPSVGPKTACIVLCFAFGKPLIPVDTHIYRVSWRLGLIPEGAGEAKAHGLLRALVPEELAYRFHMAVIQHGRAVCKAPLPRCDACPLTTDCAWYRSGGPTARREELAARRRASKAHAPAPRT
jgi:endonuclease-3